MRDVLVDYLLVNCRGYENRQKAFELMKIVDIQDHKTFRSLIEEIRQDEKEIFICSEAGKDGGYWIPTEYSEVEDTISHLVKRGQEMFKTASILRKKAQVNDIKRLYD